MSLIGIIASSKETYPGPGDNPPVSGYYAWYNAADPNSYTMNGTQIAQWDDQTGNYDLVQATSGIQPSRINKLNGRWVTTWDKKMMNNSTFAIGNSFTVFTVVNFGTQTGFGSEVGIVWAAGADSQTNGYLMIANSSGTEGLRGEGGSGNKSAKVNCNQDTWHRFVLQLNGSASTNKAILNDTTSTTVSSTNFNITASSFTVGNAWNDFFPDPNYSFTGEIAEILIYKSVLNATQLSDTDDYLASKWGL